MKGRAMIKLLRTNPLTDCEIRGMSAESLRIWHFTRCCAISKAVPIDCHAAPKSAALIVLATLLIVGCASPDPTVALPRSGEATVRVPGMNKRLKIL